jgi:hypothetical protein
MSSEIDVELIRFECPGADSRLFIPEIRWPKSEDSGEESFTAARVAELLRERLSPHGLLHSVYAAKCTEGAYGNRARTPKGRKEQDCHILLEGRRVRTTHVVGHVVE